MAATMHASTALLNREADARFWAQTHYKVGQKLNPRDPLDKEMSKVWLDIFAKVQAEDNAGKLHVTFNNPEIVALIDRAKDAGDAASAHVNAAATAPDSTVADAHVAEATRANAQAAAALREAARKQPPTVSPEVAHAAATIVAIATGKPPPPPLASQPADRSPAARPALPADVVTQPLAPDVPTPHAPPAGSPPTAQAPPPTVDSSSTSRTVTNAESHPEPQRDPLAEAKAIGSPAVAAQVHADAQADRQRGVTIPTSGTPASLLEQFRDVARTLARDADAPAVGVSLTANNTWARSLFANDAQAYDWYRAYVRDHRQYRYAAVFARDSERWPGPVEETAGDVAVPPTSHGGLGIAVPIALGAAALIGIAAVATSRKGNGSSSRSTYRDGPVGQVERTTITRRRT